MRASVWGAERCVVSTSHHMISMQASTPPNSFESAGFGMTYTYMRLCNLSPFVHMHVRQSLLYITTIQRIFSSKHPHQQLRCLAAEVLLQSADDTFHSLTCLQPAHRDFPTILHICKTTRLHQIALADISLRPCLSADNPAQVSPPMVHHVGAYIKSVQDFSSWSSDLTCRHLSMRCHSSSQTLIYFHNTPCICQDG